MEVFFHQNFKGGKSKWWRVKMKFLTHPPHHPLLPTSSIFMLGPTNAENRSCPTTNQPAEKRIGNSAISPSSLLPLSAEADNSNLDFDRGRFIISCTARTTTSFSLGAARNRTYYFCVAHFEVGGAIGVLIWALILRSSCQRRPSSRRRDRS